MTKQLVILIAPPGAGKGTQAELIAKKFGLFHVETSKILESRLFSKEKDNDAEALIAREQFRSGKLMTPSLVARIMVEEIKELAEAGKSVIFSGSFRTLEEAKKEIPLIENYYGKENIKIFNIKLGEEESINRNSNRRICSANRHPIPNLSEYKNLTVCPDDGSSLITRELDKPDVIKERYQVYKNETEPVLSLFIAHGYRVIEINGEQAIKKVFEDISQNLS